jgi:hypothetical protein
MTAAKWDGQYSAPCPKCGPVAEWTAFDHYSTVECVCIEWTARAQIARRAALDFSSGLEPRKGPVAATGVQTAPRQPERRGLARWVWRMVTQGGAL